MTPLIVLYDFIFVFHSNYTVSQKNRATLFLIIVPAFLGRFLYCLYHWKQEGILYKAADKINHFTISVSLHYTW